MGSLYYSARLNAEAIALIEKVRGRHPSANVDVACIRGVCYIQAKDCNEERSAFESMFRFALNPAPVYIFTETRLS